MHPRIIGTLLILACMPGITAFAAEDRMATLQNNPFTRPQVLKPKPPPPPAPRPVVVVPPEEVVLTLTATMVSDSAPMVVVDGELLAVGEKIQGLKLISVTEGGAVFARGGKKFAFEITSQDQK